ncbi:MAG: hypothetical protein J6A52_04170 [Bacilli bacterium]|nr:hypothetical protein [Bacilli bacterium]
MGADIKEIRHIIYEYGKKINFNFLGLVSFGQTPKELNMKGVEMGFTILKNPNLTAFQNYCNKTSNSRKKQLDKVLKIHNIPYTKRLVKEKKTEQGQYYTTYYFIPLATFGIEKVKE